MKNMKMISILILLLALLALPFIITDRYFMHVIIMIGIWIVLATSINLMIGYAGQLPMGHTAFYGLGAYVSGLLSVRLGIPFWAGAPIAGLFSTGLGFGIGKLTFKVRGSYFVLVTLGIGEVSRLVVNNWMSLTNGPMGLQGIAPISLGSYTFSPIAYYYLILLIDILVVYVSWRIVNSRYGRAFIAFNENESLGRALGIAAEKFLLLALMVSTFIAGVVGAFYAHYVMFISPDMFFLTYTVTMVVMVIVGGKRTIIGPIVGAVLFTLLPEILRPVQNYRMLIYGLILILTVLFMKKGIYPTIKDFVGKRINKNDREGGAQVGTTEH